MLPFASPAPAQQRAPSRGPRSGAPTPERRSLWSGGGGIGGGGHLGRTPMSARKKRKAAAAAGGAAAGGGAVCEVVDEAAAGASENVKVLVRIRPKNSAEREAGSFDTCTVFDVDREQTQQDSLFFRPLGESAPSMAAELRHETHGHTFRFDHVLGQQTSQSQVFDLVGQPVVDACLQGINATVFAYGQTGAGKTHTMHGAPDDPDLAGVTPRLLRYLFAQVAASGAKVAVHCSYVELYNETFRDLLGEDSEAAAPAATWGATPSRAGAATPGQLGAAAAPGPRLREDGKKGVYVEGLEEVAVSSFEDAAQLLVLGNSQRRTASTAANADSSRSHSIFTISVVSEEVRNGLTIYTRAKVNLVDLAGSERQKHTKATKERLREAQHINKSLSALSLCISKLADGDSFVNYRDSKLTHLLRDSISGNGKTWVIAGISPANSCAAETLSTLTFARSAKMIRCTARVNADTNGSEEHLRAEIARLQAENARLKEAAAATSKGSALSPVQESLGLVGDSLTGAQRQVLLDSGVANLTQSDFSPKALQGIQKEQEKLNAAMQSKSMEATSADLPESKRLAKSPRFSMDDLPDRDAESSGEESEEELSPVAFLAKRKAVIQSEIEEEVVNMEDPEIIDFLSGIEEEEVKEEGEINAIQKAEVTGLVELGRHVQHLATQMQGVETGYGIGKLKIDLRMTCELLQDMEQQKAALEKVHKQVTDELKQETEHWESQKEQHDAAMLEKTTAAAEAEARCEELANAKEELSEELECQAMTVETMEEQLTEHESRISELRTRLSTTAVQLESHSKNEKELQLQQKAELAALIAAHDTEKATINERMDEMQTELQEVNQQQVEMSTRVAKMMKEKFKAEKKVVEMTRERDDALGQVEKLEQAAQSGSAAGEGQTAEWWQGKAESLTSAVSKQQGLIKKLYVRLKEETELAKLNLQNRQAEDAMRSMRHAAMAEELTTLRTRVVEYEALLEQKEVTIAAMKRGEIRARLERALSYPLAFEALAAATTPGGTHVRPVSDEAASEAADAAAAPAEETQTASTSPAGSDISSDFQSVTSAEGNGSSSVPQHSNAAAAAVADAGAVDVATAFDLVLTGTTSLASNSSSDGSEAASARPPPSPSGSGTGTGRSVSARPALSPLTMASPRINGNAAQSAAGPMTRSRKAKAAQTMAAVGGGMGGGMGMGNPGAAAAAAAAHGVGANGPMRLGKPEYTPRGGIAILCDDMV
jgi:hypothetical protein